MLLIYNFIPIKKYTTVLNTLNNKLFLQIDNSPLIIFRIFFGFLLAAETFGAILTGWVKANLITPKILFAHIGFEWLHPLPGYGMYFYFAIMGVLGLCVMVGYRYRLTLGCFAVLWTIMYLMQKTTYNNHYYFLILACFIMFFLPANAYNSVDAKNKPKIKSLTMPQWCSFMLMMLAAVLYFYGTIAKFYPDWLDGTFTKMLYAERSDFPVIGRFFTEKWFYMGTAYLGIIFDGLVVPLLLWRKTRTLALIACFVFHLLNSMILQVGIFPYLSLSFVVFFYPPETMRKLFFKKRPTVTPFYKYDQKGMNILKYVFIPFFLVQILLPLRQHLIKGQTVWTDEAHKLSWRMMLRRRSGHTSFKIIDKKTKENIYYNVDGLLTSKQRRALGSSADIIWQMAQYIKKDLKKQEKDVEIYADCFLSINGHQHKRFIDDKVDLASAKWNYFWHNDWVLLYDDYRK